MARSSTAVSRVIRQDQTPRDLGPQFEFLLARWYGDMFCIAQINRLVDIVVSEFELCSELGLHPHSRGWCQYQQDLYDQLCAKQAA